MSFPRSASIFPLLLASAALVHCSADQGTQPANGYGSGGTSVSASGGVAGSAALAGSSGTATASGGGGTAGAMMGGTGGTAGAMTGGTGGQVAAGSGGTAGTLAGAAAGAQAGAGGQGGLGGSTAGGAAGNAGSEMTGGSAGMEEAAGGNGGAGGAASGGAAGLGGAGGMGGAGGSAGTGGTPGWASNLPFSFYIGADVSGQESQSASTRDSLLSVLKQHGFNYIRLRMFVDPRASDGYDKNNGYCGTEQTASFGKQIKDAGMGFLLDFHYADNWADPSKQCVPVAWQDLGTIEELAQAVHDYTSDAITQLIAGGARPDMVQIGNEITPGMLIHRCNSGGQPQGNNPVTGSISNWSNLGALLSAASQGVRDVDPEIMISLHIDRGNDYNSSRSFITNARDQGVVFQAFGESCYTAYQGQPSEWRSTFTQLASDFPDLKFFIAEYGPEQKAANDILYELPNEQGIGTFNWEPTSSGPWNTGHDLLRRSGNSYSTQPDMALYDQMTVDYAPRL